MLTGGAAGADAAGEAEERVSPKGLPLQPAAEKLANSARLAARGKKRRVIIPLHILPIGCRK
jgi:hypothetical protein